jgi:hypothetical protein
VQWEWIAVADIERRLALRGAADTLDIAMGAARTRLRVAPATIGPAPQVALPHAARRGRAPRERPS